MNLDLKKKIEALGLAERAENIAWSFDGVEFASRTSPQQVFRTHPSQIQRPVLDFKSEVLLAARKIAEKEKGKIQILYSGGLDSELVAWAFLQQGLPIELVFVNFMYTNGHDRRCAERFAKLHRIDLKVLSFDVKSFWENELVAWAHELQSSSPQFCVWAKILSEMDGFVVMGGGDLNLSRINATDFYEVAFERENLNQWALKVGQRCCPEFFRYTAELEMAWLLDPLVQDFIQIGSKAIHARKMRYLKPFLFYHHFGLRLREKLTGFEMHEELEEKYRVSLRQNIPGDSLVCWSYQDYLEMKQNGINVSNWEWIELDSSDLAQEERQYLMNGSAGRALLLRKRSAGREEG